MDFNFTGMSTLPITNSYMHFSRPDGVGDTPRVDSYGCRWLDSTGGDFFVGASNIAGFEDYYWQGTTKANTSTTGFTEMASNVFQGSWGNGANPIWPFVEIQYNIGGGAVGKYITLGEDDTTYILDGATTFGIYDSGAGLGGGGVVIGARISGCGVYHHFDTANERYNIRTMSNSSKAAQKISQIGLAGTRLVSFLPVTTATVSNGTSTNEWLDGSYSNDVRMRQVICDGDNAGVASTNSLTGTSDVTANSTGVGTIKFKGATSRDSTGFIKIYVGTTAYYVPFFSAITG